MVDVERRKQEAVHAHTKHILYKLENISIEKIINKNFRNMDKPELKPLKIYSLRDGGYDINIPKS